MEDVPFDIFELLDQPLLTASVATVGRSGGPTLGSMWFAFDDRRFWFSTREGESPFLEAARARHLVAVMVTVFDPPKNIRLLRATGPAQLERHDPKRVQTIYERYLGTRLDDWPTFFRERLEDETFRLWSVHAVSGKAEEFPDFEGSEFRWTEPSPFLDRSQMGRDTYQ